MTRMLEILRPEIETKLNSWSSCMPNNRDTTKEDCFNEISVMLRVKFRSYLHAIVEKLAENVSTHWKNTRSFVWNVKQFCRSINLLKNILCLNMIGVWQINLLCKVQVKWLRAHSFRVFSNCFDRRTNFIAWLQVKNMPQSC